MTVCHVGDTKTPASWYGSQGYCLAVDLAIGHLLPLFRPRTPGHSLPSVVTQDTVYPKKYARGYCFAVLCCGYALTDFPISIRLTSLALWQSNDCPSASKATLMNMDKYFMLIHYERLHNHNKAKHNKTVCIFLGIYCRFTMYTIDIENTAIAILSNMWGWRFLFHFS